MQDQIKHISGYGVERTIVVRLLEEDRQDGCARAQLARELGLAGTAFEAPLAHLREEGVVELTDETVRASRATAHLDSLEMIAI